MSGLKATTDEILSEIKKSISSLKTEQVEKMIDMITESGDRKIFVVGAGRSGLIGRAFAMRLMHLGFNAYVVGETITPALSRGDILLAVSGSGATTFSLEAAKTSKRAGGKVIAITSYPNSPIGRLADHVVILKGKTKMIEETEVYKLPVPLGTLFEASCLVFFDSVVVELMHRLNKTEEYMRRRHTTIE